MHDIQIYNYAGFIQSCRCDGILEVWDINEALVVSKLNLNAKVYYCKTLIKVTLFSNYDPRCRV